MRIHAMGAATVCLLVGLATAQAQINPFGNSKVTHGLTKADMEQLSAATQRLNAQDRIKAGDTQDWSNPNTGNSGKVTVTRLFQSGGMTCHSVNYDIAYKPPRPTRHYTASWCKTKSGAWRIKH